MRTIFTGLIAFFILIIGTYDIQAQEKSNQEIKTSPFQLTLITPLGTNGINSWNYTNNVSLNIYAGYNGGLNGFELSGFGSLLKYNMKGTQIAGFTNVVMEDGEGYQLAGFANYLKCNNKGLQAAGFVNVLTKPSQSSQIAGFVNVATDSLDGFQLAGFNNYAKNNEKGQISGFSNTNVGDLKGIQLSGAINVSTKSVDGAQIAGFINYTQKLKGFQFATINYVDSLEEGIPVGVFSIVRNGYSAFEISSNETLYGVFSYKTGVKKFYNILSAGTSYKNGKTYWGFGYGIGTLMPLKNEWDIAFELISYHINEDEWFTDITNSQNKLQITTSKKISEKFNLFVGASCNVHVSEIEKNNGNTFKSEVIPYHIFNKTYNNKTNVKIYPGFTAGIRF